MSNRLQITYVSPEELAANPWNPNKVGPENLSKIEKSVSELEDFKPVVVRELETGELEIVDGEHRTEVYRRLGQQVPVVNLGNISDEHAKKITLAANARYGENDTIALHDLLASLGSMEELAQILPESTESLEEIANLSTSAGDIDWNDLTLDDEESEEDASYESSAPAKSVKQTLKFRLDVDQSEEVDAYLSKIIRTIGADDSDPAVNRGLALMHIIEQLEKSGEAS